MIRYRYFVVLQDNDKFILRHEYHGYRWLVVASSQGIEYHGIILFLKQHCGFRTRRGGF